MCPAPPRTRSIGVRGPTAGGWLGRKWGGAATMGLSGLALLFVKPHPLCPTPGRTDVALQNVPQLHWGALGASFKVTH